MSAIISDCGRYRYRLGRTIAVPDGNLTIAYFGINPSTADATIDDQTVLKWTVFTQCADGCEFVVGNAFAYRSADVKVLAAVADPVGPDNDRHLMSIIKDADILVPCWGSANKLPKPLRSRLTVLTSLLFASGKPVKIFGLTKDGDPKHPLFLPHSTELTDWE